MSSLTNLDRSLSCTVRVYLTSQDTPMLGPPRGRHVYVVGLLHGWGLSGHTEVKFDGKIIQRLA